MSFFDPEQEDKLKEECGVFGIYNPDGSAAAPSIYYGLSALGRLRKNNIPQYNMKRKQAILHSFSVFDI